MKALRSLLFTAAIVLIAVPAAGQIQQPAYTPASPPATEHLKWFLTQPYGVNWPYTLNGVFYGPYSAFVTAHPTVGFIDLYCIDAAHSAIIGPSGWDAWFSPIGDDLSYTRHGNAARDDYEQLTWYASQMRLDNRDEWVGIHAAMWHVFTPTKSWLYSSINYASEITKWENDWLTVKGSYTPSPYWHVVTPTVNGELGDGQEFLTYVTPEPETIFLLGTGLVAVFGMSIVMRRSLG